MIAIIFRGPNGHVSWSRLYSGPTTYVWSCERDKFKVPAPSSIVTIETTLTAMAQHSSTLVGQVQQIVQLDL